MSHDNGAPFARTFKKLGVKNVKYPERICFILDHAVPAPSSDHAVNHKEVREFVAEHAGIPNFYDVKSEGGVCHQKLCEEGYALPGLVMVGSDSHTCTYGAYGALLDRNRTQRDGGGLGDRQNLVQGAGKHEGRRHRQIQARRLCKGFHP